MLLKTRSSELRASNSKLSEPPLAWNQVAGIGKDSEQCNYETCIKSPTQKATPPGPRNPNTGLAPAEATLSQFSSTLPRWHVQLLRLECWLAELIKILESRALDATETHSLRKGIQRPLRETAHGSACSSMSEESLGPRNPWAACAAFVLWQQGSSPLECNPQHVPAKGGVQTSTGISHNVLWKSA